MALDGMSKALSQLSRLATSGTPPDSQTASKISVGLDGTLSRVQNEVFPYLSAGGTEIQFIYGANGRGKTHYLLSMEEIAKNRGFVTARIDCPAGKSPFGSLRSTYEMIASSLVPPPTMQLSSAPSQGASSIVSAALSGKNSVEIKEVIARIKTSKHLSPDFRNLVLAYGASVLTGSTITDKVEKSLEALLLGSSTNLISISELYRADKSLPKPLGRITSRNAATWLRSLLSLPAALGYPGCVIMFDETERAFHGVSSSAMQQQLANMRNLVDYCALGAFSGCLILYSAAEQFLDFTRRHLDALAQRIEPPSMLDSILMSNQRSIWTDLEDLTSPHTDDKAFFVALSEKIVQLGVEAGLTAARVEPLKRTLSSEAQSYARAPTSGVVRQFVKYAASKVAMEVR